MVFSILRMLLGLMFITSAVLKLFPIDAFELILIRQLGVSWDVAPVLSRALIFFEFSLGAFLLFGAYVRASLWTGMAILTAFSLHLLFLIITGRGGENCGCFGELLPMDAPVSLIKNLGFMVVTALLLFRVEKASRWSWKHGGWILPVLAFPALMVIFPMPEAVEMEDAKLDRTVLEAAGVINGEEKAPGVVLILYAKCIHCMQVANLVATNEDARVKEDLMIVIYGKEDRVDWFVHEAHLESFRHMRTSDRALMVSFKGTFPTLVQLDQGEVTGIWQGDNITKSLLSRLMAPGE